MNKTWNLIVGGMGALILLGISLTLGGIISMNAQISDLRERMARVETKVDQKLSKQASTNDVIMAKIAAPPS